MQAVINVAIAPLTTNPALWAQNPQQSRLVDELLLGMPVEICLLYTSPSPRDA